MKVVLKKRTRDMEREEENTRHELENSLQKLEGY